MSRCLLYCTNVIISLDFRGVMLLLGLSECGIWNKIRNMCVWQKTHRDYLSYLGELYWWHLICPKSSLEIYAVSLSSRCLSNPSAGLIRIPKCSWIWQFSFQVPLNFLEFMGVFWNVHNFYVITHFSKVLAVPTSSDILYSWTVSYQFTLIISVMLLRGRMQLIIRLIKWFGWNYHFSTFYAFQLIV